MADKKISALTSKGSNLDSTDIFAIAEDDGAGGYTSKGVSGDEVKKSITEIPVNEQTGNYTLVLADQDKLIEMNVALVNTLTIPTNASVSFAIGTQIAIVQKGAGKTTITGDTGVTVYSEGSKVSFVGQYGLATIIKCDTDTWYLGGNLEV